MAVAAGIALVGTGLQIYGQREASKATERANLEIAESKRLQAFELLDRFETNADALRTRGKRFQDIQASQYAKGGVDIGQGSPLVAQAETLSLVDRQISLERKEAQSKADALMRGADIDTRLAGDVAATRDLQTAGLFMGGLTNAYTTYKAST